MTVPIRKIKVNNFLEDHTIPKAKKTNVILFMAMSPLNKAHNKWMKVQYKRITKSFKWFF